MKALILNLLLLSTYSTILWVRKWNFSLRHFTSIWWKISRLNIQSCEVYSVSETSLDAALLWRTETFPFMLSRKPGSAEDSISPLAFNVFFPPLSYLGAWRCGKRFPCSSSLLSDLSLLPKNPNFSISCQTILHIIYLVALCRSAFWNIFSGVFSLLLSHTLPVIILIII